MNRRKFLGLSAGAVGAGCLGTAVGEGPSGRRSSTSLTSPVSAVGADRAIIQEAPRRTPVAADVDVLVVGVFVQRFFGVHMTSPRRIRLLAQDAQPVRVAA